MRSRRLVRRSSPYLKKSRIESFFARELMPYVERAFPVLPKRGVMGMSMGGHGSFVLALRHPGSFASVSSMSGVMDITRHPDQWKIRDVLGPMNANKALWQSYSAEDLLKRSKAAGMPAMLITTGQQDAYGVPRTAPFGIRSAGAGSPISTARRPASTTGRIGLTSFPYM